jgi:hypothetical protein
MGTTDVDRKYGTLASLLRTNGSQNEHYRCTEERKDLGSPDEK